VLPVLKMLECGETDVAALTRRILTQGGFFAHLGSNDLREIEARIDSGEEKAALVYEAFVRAVARDVASLAPLFVAQIAPQAARPSGGEAARRNLDLDAIVVTGGMARSARLVADLSARLAFLAPLIPVTGLEEMHALADGARLALTGQTAVREYTAANA
jgi:butyrate kinase